MPPRKRAAAAPRKRAAAKKTPGGTELSVVPADAKPAARARRKKPLTLLQAIEAGDYLEILRAQRRELVTDLKGASGPAKAAMHRQLAIQSKEIAQLEAEAKAIADEEAEGGSHGDTDEAFDAEAL